MLLTQPDLLIAARALLNPAQSATWKPVREPGPDRPKTDRGQLLLVVEAHSWMCTARVPELSISA